MEDDGQSDDPSEIRELRMAARATVELFGNGAVAKTRERLAEVEAEGNADATDYWRALLAEVKRLHSLRQNF